MTPRSGDKRERLLAAARELIHEQGFGRTTLADIAERSGVPVGNVYYYFKTKDEIANAVLQERQGEFRAAVEMLEQDPDPRERLRAYLRAAIEHREVLAERGCPIGSLSQELNKDRSDLAECTNSILRLQVDWVAKQFELLGKGNARERAMHIIATQHGAVMMANAFADPGLITLEMERLERELIDG